jgi:hypothetical protein
MDIGILRHIVYAFLRDKVRQQSATSDTHLNNLTIGRTHE